ncbi:hypothetical protein L9F63_013864, partial [Diploptera punctata]
YIVRKFRPSRLPVTKLASVTRYLSLSPEKVVGLLRNTFPGMDSFGREVKPKTCLISDNFHAPRNLHNVIKESDRKAWIIRSVATQITASPGGLVVIDPPLIPRFLSSNPARIHEIFEGVKLLSIASFEREVKPLIVTAIRFRRLYFPSERSLRPLTDLNPRTSEPKGATDSYLDWFCFIRFPVSGMLTQLSVNFITDHLDFWTFFNIRQFL